MKTLELNLPAPVLLVWGLPEDAEVEETDFNVRENKYVRYWLSGKDYLEDFPEGTTGNWQLIGKLSELTDTEILRSISDKGYYFTNPVPEPEYMDGGLDGGGYDDGWIKEYEEAQSKTLPANTLIFKRV